MVGDDDDSASLLGPSERGSSDMREDISTAEGSSALLRRVKDAEVVVEEQEEVDGESLLISSPMMARGAQPYMAHDLIMT